MVTEHCFLRQWSQIPVPDHTADYKAVAVGLGWPRGNHSLREKRWFALIQWWPQLQSLRSGSDEFWEEKWDGHELITLYFSEHAWAEGVTNLFNLYLCSVSGCRGKSSLLLKGIVEVSKEAAAKHKNWGLWSLGWKLNHHRRWQCSVFYPIHFDKQFCS